MADKEIRVAIIGTGDISHRHMKVWRHIPQVKVVAAAEIDEKKLKNWGESYGFDNKDLYTDFRTMLKRDDIDAVDVCVHNNLHAPVAITVMKAGYPCYSEKPMSGSYYDSKLMLDTARECGVKLAIQISSLFTEQTRIAKKLITKGYLGKLYHARCIQANYRRRPAVDGPYNMGSRDFINAKTAAHGQILDLGIYDLGQMLYLLGLPELKQVFGKSYHMIDSPIPAKEITIEDMALGLAEYEGGLTLDFQEANASNVEISPTFYINGDKGAVNWWNPDGVGGEWSMGNGFGNLLPESMQPGLRFTGLWEGTHVDCDMRAYFNQMQNRCYDPEMMKWYDNQMHWYKYLIGELDDTTRYNTPEIGLAVSLLVDGLFISEMEGRSVSAEEIKDKSRSLAIWRQETPWGVFDYDE